MIMFIYCISASTPPAPIRLVGGKGSHEGRLEIFHSGEWGTICIDDSQGWGKEEADVVCRQLGYQPDGYVRRITYPTSANIFGELTGGKIWLDHVKCNVSDDKYNPKTFVLKDCEHGAWGGSGSCDHSRDVGVICSDGENQMISLISHNTKYHLYMFPLFILFTYFIYLFIYFFLFYLDVHSDVIICSFMKWNSTCEFFASEANP